jgi:hypothetical protein
MMQWNKLRTVDQGHAKIHLNLRLKSFALGHWLGTIRTYQSKKYTKTGPFRNFFSLAQPREQILYSSTLEIGSWNHRIRYRVGTKLQLHAIFKVE